MPALRRVSTPWLRCVRGASVGREGAPRPPAGCARWGRDRRYVLRYAATRGGLGDARFHGPILSCACADDPYAPRAAGEARFRIDSAARTEPRYLRPEDPGATAIGHFAPFPRRFRDTLWLEIRDRLLGEAGRSPVEEGRAWGPEAGRRPRAVQVGRRSRPLARSASARTQQPSRWSLTSPTACMKA